MDILTLHILHNHAEMATCLKGTKHGYNKGVLRKGEDVPFHKGLLNLVPQDQVLLIDFLHGKSLVSLQVTHKIHSSGTNTTTDICPRYCLHIWSQCSF